MRNQSFSLAVGGISHTFAIKTLEVWKTQKLTNWTYRAIANRSCFCEKRRKGARSRFTITKCGGFGYRRVVPGWRNSLFRWRICGLSVHISESWGSIPWRIMGRPIKLIGYLCFLMALCSCKETKEQQISRLIHEWEGRTIVYPAGMTFSVLGKDSAGYSFPQNEYTIMTYVDSVGCTSCKLQLPTWKR